MPGNVPKYLTNDYSSILIVICAVEIIAMGLLSMGGYWGIIPLILSFNYKKAVRAGATSYAKKSFIGAIAFIVLVPFLGYFGPLIRAAILGY